MNKVIETVFEKHKKTSKYSQPFFITRFGIAFFDLILVLIIAIGCQIGFYNTAFKLFHYEEKVEELRNIAKDSGLYVVEGSSYVEVTKAYIDTDDQLKEFDKRIIYFYTNNERAIKDNKIEEYKNAKVITNFFTYDETGNLVEKSTVDKSYFVNFYTEQYNLALQYLMFDETYIVDANDTFLIFIIFLLVSLAIGSTAIYLFIPMVTKNHVTPAQALFKVVVVDYVKDKEITKKQILIRFLILLIFEYWIPVLIFTRIQMLSLIPLLITIGTTAFTKKNLAPHEYLTGTMSVSIRNGKPVLEGKPERPEGPDIVVPDVPPLD